VSIVGRFVSIITPFHKKIAKDCTIIVKYNN